jgi:uncharacterized protein (DUF1330 family)
MRVRVLLALATLLLNLGCVRKGTTMGTPPTSPAPASSTRYFQLVLLWPRDPVLYGRYLEALRPIVADYEGRLEHRFQPHTFYATGLERPAGVNFVSYRDREAFRRFREDERFLRIVGMRTSSTALASVEGVSVRESVLPGAAEGRRYVIEIARYGAGGAGGYADYEREAEPVMARYGYHVERVVQLESHSTMTFEHACGMCHAHLV